MGEIDNDFADVLDQEVKKARENKEWRLEYMTLFMKLQESLEEGIAQGMAQGIAQGMAQGDLMRLIFQVRKKVEKDFSAAETAEMLEEDVHLISKIMEFITHFSDLNDEEIYNKLNS